MTTRTVIVKVDPLDCRSCRTSPPMINLFENVCGCSMKIGDSIRSPSKPDHTGARTGFTTFCPRNVNTKELHWPNCTDAAQRPHWRGHRRSRTFSRLLASGPSSATHSLRLPISASNSTPRPNAHGGASASESDLHQFGSLLHTLKLTKTQ